jgi:hypothetical protein
MEVSGFRLPRSFVALLESIAGGSCSTFRLREGTDAYGNRFDAELRILPESVRVGHPMQEWVNPRRIRMHDAQYACDPGFIPHPTDYSKLVFICESGEGDEFVYLDFRDNPEEPSVIHQGEDYWRRVAPDFQAFIDLLRPICGVS